MWLMATLLDRIALDSSTPKLHFQLLSGFIHPDKLQEHPPYCVEI